MRSDVKSSIESVAVVGLAATFAYMVPASSAGPGATSKYTAYANRSAISLKGTFRDFSDDHPDFSGLAFNGAGRYAGFFGDALGENGKPVFKSSGRRFLQNARGQSGLIIMPPRSYIRGRPGDQPAEYSDAEGHAMTASGTSQLFNHVPGTNESTGSDITFVRRPGSGNFVFDGTLDRGGSVVSGSEPSGNTSYTHEISTTFVYEAGHDLFIEAETDAEMWVYIDGKLVIDGGAGRGAGVDFDIIDGRVIPREDFVAQIQVLGAAIGNGTYELPVTMQATIGDDVAEPFGEFDRPTRGNLNDDQSVTGNINPGVNPRTFSPTETYPPGTEISIIGASWTRISGTGLEDEHWEVARQHGTNDGSPQVFVLRDGDPVPNIAAMYNQASISEYVDNFVNQDTNTINLGVNEIIYLFELGTTHDNSNADFQDLVALVTLAPADPDHGGPGTGHNPLTGIPTLNQRIELDRLTHLRDGRTHDLKVFYLDRTKGTAPVRLETNITTLRLAAIPKLFENPND